MTTAAVEERQRTATLQRELLALQRRLQSEVRLEFAMTLKDFIAKSPLIESVRFTVEMSTSPSGTRIRSAYLHLDCSPGKAQTGVLTSFKNLLSYAEPLGGLDVSDALVEHLEAAGVLDQWAELLDCGESTVRFEASRGDLSFAHATGALASPEHLSKFFDQ